MSEDSVEWRGMIPGAWIEVGDVPGFRHWASGETYSLRFPDCDWLERTFDMLAFVRHDAILCTRTALSDRVVMAFTKFGWAISPRLSWTIEVRAPLPAPPEGRTEEQGNG